jgi:hypothetical protein
VRIWVTLLVVRLMLQALSTMLDREALVCLILVAHSPNSKLRNLHFNIFTHARS